MLACSLLAAGSRWRSAGLSLSHWLLMVLPSSLPSVHYHVSVSLGKLITWKLMVWGSKRDGSREAKQTPGLWTQISEVASHHVCHSLLISTASRSDPHLEKGTTQDLSVEMKESLGLLETVYHIFPIMAFFFPLWFLLTVVCPPSSNTCLFPFLYLAPCLHSHHAYCCPLVCIYS